jgi:hypothetical protein
MRSTHNLGQQRGLSIPYSLFPIPCSSSLFHFFTRPLFTAFVIQITVSKKSPIFGV